MGLLRRKTNKIKYRVGWKEGPPTWVRWECTCGAIGRWRDRATPDNKLKRLWNLHVKQMHSA